MAGYSGTPLVKKLGIKESFNAALANAPPNFQQEPDLPKGVSINSRTRKPPDFVLFFVKSKRELETGFSLYAAN